MYALISHATVAHFNALQSKDIIVPIPLHAAIMLGHALGARLGLPVSGVALVVHNAQVEVETLPELRKDKSGDKGSDQKKKTSNRRHTLFLSNKRGASAFYVDRKAEGGGYASTSRTPSATAYQLHATANGCFSLALDFGEAEPTKEEIKDQLSIMRFAGGSFQSMPDIVLAQTRDELLRNIRSGYVVTDAAWRAQAALDSGLEPAQVYLNRHESGYVLPLNVGYHLITEVSNNRQGMRQPPGVKVQGHAFAESVIGLVELVHINRLKFPADAQSDDAAEEEGHGADEADDVGLDDVPDDDAPLGDVTDAESETDSATSPPALFWHHRWSADRRSFLIHQP